jgi:hypothetical protein
MDPVKLQAALWIPMVIVGGALSTFALAHYAIDLMVIRRDEEATDFQREIAYHRVRAEFSRVLGWGVFLLLGLSAAGWQFDPLMWSFAFFATMFYWFYAAARAFQMRLRYGASGEEKRGGDDHVTGV